MVIGIVQGDLHDIGKNLPIMMPEGVVFEVIDLEIDVQPDAFVMAVQEHNPDLLAPSALLTTTMPKTKTTIATLDETDLPERVEVVVGGAPITADFAQGIGADRFAPDASRAAALAKLLVI